MKHFNHVYWIACIVKLLIFNSSAEASYPYFDIEKDRMYITGNEHLSEFSSQALSGPILSLYMVHAAQKYFQLFNDSNINQLPLQDRAATIYVHAPDNELDTLYQIDLRIYSPSYVGRRYNRMVIVRPYDQKKRPCVLYTHGNNGNLNTWYNYYLIGAASMLQRGYAVAFYENYNNSDFNSKSKSDLVYRDWVHNNLADTSQSISEDHVLQRGHYLLYQYAYAAHTFLTYVADEYHLDKEMLFTAGHSAGGLSSMQLTFARPEKNFKHSIFEYCGAFDSRTYKEIPDERIPIKGVLCSAAGLQDETVQGSYFGKYLDEGHQDKVVVMVHGLEDPLAPVDRGPALWGNFVDTVKMLGPLSLHPKMNDVGIKNFSFINCIGQHGVYMYPATANDRGGVFKNLAPFSYDQDTLKDEDFITDISLYQVYLYHQQLDKKMGDVAKIFSLMYHQQSIDLPSAIYTWRPNDYFTPIDSLQLNWAPKPTDCSVNGALIENFDVGVMVATNEYSKEDFYLYPNPALDRLNIELDHNDSYEYAIYDLVGKQQTAWTTVLHQQVNVSTLARGVYFLLLKNKETKELSYKKFVKQ